MRTWQWITSLLKILHDFLDLIDKLTDIENKSQKKGISNYLCNAFPIHPFGIDFSFPKWMLVRSRKMPSSTYSIFCRNLILRYTTFIFYQNVIRLSTE